MKKYNTKTEDKKCIFCEIAKGNISPMGNGKFYESKKFMAFLSPFPNTEGFALIIPKSHYPGDVLKMPDEKLSEFIIEAKKTSKILENYFEDVGRVGLIMEGTGIDHAHIKLFPMHKTKHMKEGIFKKYQSNMEQVFFEEYEGYISSHDGKKANEEEIEKLAKKIKESQK